MDTASSSSNCLSLTTPTAGWFITSLIFVGMLVDGLMTILCCMIFCSSFMLCCVCNTITEGRTRRCLDWPSLADVGAPPAAVDVDDPVNVGARDESRVVRSADGAGPRVLLGTPVLIGMPSFPEIPCGAFRRGEDEVVVCTVCLSDIGDGELAVELPFCAHFFHVECVDPWLRDHLTCPNCRVCVSETPTTSATMAITVVAAGRRGQTR